MENQLTSSTTTAHSLTYPYMHATLWVARPAGQPMKQLAVKLGAIRIYNMMPLECLEKIFGQFLDWKAETRDIGDPLKFLAATTYSNLRQCLLGFIAMCRHYLDKFPGVKIPQWRVNDDAIEHHFRNVRGATGDNTTPTIHECCAATRHATIIRLFGDQAGNSGGSPVGAVADDVDYDVQSHAPAVESSGMTIQEKIFSFNFQTLFKGS